MNNMLKQFEDFIEMSEVRNKIELLETKAAVYSDRDRVRMNAIVLEIKALEMKLLDLMVVSATID